MGHEDNPSIHKIAKLAGVSIAVVSHAFSGNRSVNLDTKARVKQIAAEYGYKANENASMMGQSNSLAARENKSTTIRDVAREANVSIATVSFVLNGVPRVAPETRDRVKKAIANLNFQPNTYAQNLRKGKVGN